MGENRAPKNPESKFLNLLFLNLIKHNVPFAVMRNYEQLPLSTNGSDLDILIDPKSEPISRVAISMAISEASGLAIGTTKTVNYEKIFAFGRNCYENQPAKWWGLRLDISYGLFFEGGVKLLEARWERNEKYKDISVLPSGLAATLGVLKEILHNSNIPDRYIVKARRAVRMDWDAIASSLSPMGDQALSLFSKIITELPVKEFDLQARCKELRRSLRLYALRHYPISYLVRRTCFEWSKVRRFFSPSGVVVAFLGVDGSGKSTVIDSIKPILDNATHNATHIQHLRPTLLPPLARLIDKRETLQGPVLNPHGSKPSRALVSILRLFYLTLDYVLGYWLKIRPMIAKQPAIVIFDRYAYDMEMDPKRFRIGVPSWVAGLFACIAPKPDLIFCLHAKPDVILSRKKELPREEISGQLEFLKAFSQKNPRAILISNEGSVEEVRDEVLSKLFDFFKSRTQRSNDYA